jgi:hypothetical protein
VQFLLLFTDLHLVFADAATYEVDEAFFFELGQALLEDARGCVAWLVAEFELILSFLKDFGVLKDLFIGKFHRLILGLNGV